MDRAQSLLRPASGILHHPFLNPGGTYLDQLWDWDSYWVARGLFDLADWRDDAALASSVLSHGQGSLRNILNHQGGNGSLPILMRPDNPDVFGCCDGKKPFSNPAKPIFAQFTDLLYRRSGDQHWLREVTERLDAYYAYWEERFLTPSGLYVWATDAAIGVDNDPTTYGRPFFSSANLLLNCFLYKDLKTAAELCNKGGGEKRSQKLGAQADRLGASIRRHCWDEQDGFFYSVDTQCRDHRADLIPPDQPRGMDMSWNCLPLKVKMFHGFLPLWCGLASEAQAQAMVRRYLTAEHFLGDAGCRTLSRQERFYDPETESSNPSNWLGPVWTIATYLVWLGIRSYGFRDEADILARSTLNLLAGDIEASGSVHEQYHPETGKPNFNADFISWNLLSMQMLKGTLEDLP